MVETQEQLVAFVAHWMRWCRSLDALWRRMWRDDPEAVKQHRNRLSGEFAYINWESMSAARMHFYGEPLPMDWRAA